MSTRSTLEFLKTETGSGLLLVLAGLAAIAMANSPWAGAYHAFIEAPITIRIGGFSETMSVLKWVKNGLMAIFFFVVGLEIKYEILKGELSNPRRLALPVLAAVGGVVGPALIYLAINTRAGGAPQGWPTPTATDIAFALAALAVAGPRLPPALRIFLLTLAIVDDLVAVAFIGLLFTADIHWGMAAGAVAVLGVLALMSRWKTAPYVFYAVALLLLWGFASKSGINTSIAAVAAAFTIPIGPRRPGETGVLHRVMESLHPYVAFAILPLFAFTAAGFSVTGPEAALVTPMTVGLALGLFLGKQLGVFGAALLAIGLKLARRPTGARWLELYGVSLLCGIGFTMSLFIGGLAFDPADAAAQSQVRIGVAAGSILSTLAGMAVLAWAQARRRAEEDAA